MWLRSTRLSLALALSLVVLVGVGASGCSQDRSKLVGMWRCKGGSCPALDYAFSSDGTYREHYVGQPGGPPGTITGTWTLSYTPDSRPGIALQAKEDPCAGGLRPYHFVGDDELVLDGVTLVRQR
jgi:hypothetical protein